MRDKPFLLLWFRRWCEAEWHPTRPTCLSASPNYTKRPFRPKEFAPIEQKNKPIVKLLILEKTTNNIQISNVKRDLLQWWSAQGNRPIRGWTFDAFSTWSHYLRPRHELWCDPTNCDIRYKRWNLLGTVVWNSKAWNQKENDSIVRLTSRIAHSRWDSIPVA